MVSWKDNDGEHCEDDEDGDNVFIYYCHECDTYLEIYNEDDYEEEM